jgi:hypothetical protein
MELVGGPPSVLKDWIVNEMQRWTKLIAEAGIKPPSK